VTGASVSTAGHVSAPLAAADRVTACLRHELANQMALVLGNADLLRLKLQGTPDARSAEDLTAAADRAVRLVEHFLGMLRPPERVQVALPAMVEQAVDLYARALRRDAVEVVYAMDEPEYSVYADPHRLRLLLVTMVARAHEGLQTARRPRDLTIAVRAGSDPGSVVVEMACPAGPGPSWFPATPPDGAVDEVWIAEEPAAAGRVVLRLGLPCVGSGRTDEGGADASGP
jgi:C4-dicarboxylate-specific signal transduction histidine kinase